MWFSHISYPKKCLLQTRAFPNIIKEDIQIFPRGAGFSLYLSELLGEVPLGKHQGIYWSILGQPATQKIRVLGWTEGCPRERANPWLRMDFKQRYLAASDTPSSFPIDRSSQQRVRGHRKKWRRKFLGIVNSIKTKGCSARFLLPSDICARATIFSCSQPKAEHNWYNGEQSTRLLLLKNSLSWVSDG